METYIVNGKEIQYDTFDLVNMEVYRDECKRVSEGTAEAQRKFHDGDMDYVECIREMCELAMDALDTICGEGTSEILFGGKVNAKTVPESWKEFTGAVAETLGESSGHSGMNREQRRAAERSARREAARQRVEARQNEK